jgi:hypothetical protein
MARNLYFDIVARGDLEYTPARYGKAHLSYTKPSAPAFISHDIKLQSIMLLKRSRRVYAQPRAAVAVFSNFLYYTYFSADVTYRVRVKNALSRRKAVEIEFCRSS